MKHSLITLIANLEQTGKTAVRIGIVVVFFWIGFLKFFTYEADGIVPFVANSPFMSGFYSHPDDYKKHMNAEGALVEANHQWHQSNNTYGFATGLGIFLVVVSVLVALYKVLPLPSLIASGLIFIMSIGTLSFLVTTPESWVPHLGDENWGFPFLSGRGRLVLKDIVILGGSILNMSETAQLYLRRLKKNNPGSLKPAAQHHPSVRPVN